MRELKFRAWDKEWKKMFEVNEISWLYGGVHYTEYKEKDWECDCFSHSTQFRLFKDCILLQYTGLKDKNGKEIWEGDVVKLRDKITQVTWDNVLAGFIFRGNQLYTHPVDKVLEIIGNIYENPELLK